jgi:hypothetical protein
MTSAPDNFLAVFLGSKSSPRMQAWMAMPEAERKAKERDGIAAWHGWMEKHQGVIVYAGGPLGKTKHIGPEGIRDASNALSGFVVVRAASHEEAARLFENHPHFAAFPGDSVEVMPLLPIPMG